MQYANQFDLPFLSWSINFRMMSVLWIKSKQMMFPVLHEKQLILDVFFCVVVELPHCDEKLLLYHSRLEAHLPR